ncbi:sigma-70 family RNA polymerase sigma factor [Verrucomicrobia bacterium S94]|nr:sigma-70 family RNA polymerase sigma factor [Verrucomicrobia bacterium S94]
MMTEQEKIEYLLKAYYAEQDRFRGYVFSATKDYHATEDILQSIAIVVAQKAAVFDMNRDLMPWLMGIARNKIKHWFYHHGKQVRNVQFEVLENCLVHHSGAFGQDELSPRQEALMKCLKRLPSKQKKVLELRYVGRKDCSSVAEELGRSVQSIYSTLKRVKRELRKCIERRTAELEIV